MTAVTSPARTAGRAAHDAPPAAGHDARPLALTELDTGRAPEHDGHRWGIPRWVERLAGVVWSSALWQLAATGRAGSPPARWPARPTRSHAIVKMLEAGTLQSRGVGRRSSGCCWGLGLGIPLGTFLAVAAGLSRLGDDLIDATVQMLRFVPIIGLQPLFIAVARRRRDGQDLADRARRGVPRLRQHLLGDALDRSRATSSWPTWSGSAGRACIRRVVLPARCPASSSACAWPPRRLAAARVRRADQRHQRHRLPDDQGPDVLPDRRHRRRASSSTRCSGCCPTRSSASSSGGCCAGNQGGEPTDRSTLRRLDRRRTSAVAVRSATSTRRFGDREVLRGIDLDVCTAASSWPCSGAAARARARCCGPSPASTTASTGAIARARAASVVFQDPRLLPWATVLDNVILGLRRPRRRRAGPGRAGRGRARRPRRRLAQDALGRRGPAGRAGPGPRARARPAPARRAVRRPRRAHPHPHARASCRSSAPATDPAVLLVTHDVDEALLLADRVLVLTDGVISLDVPVDVPSPRLRGDRRFIDLRSRLLAELGVDEAAEGDPRRSRTSDPRTIRSTRPTTSSTHDRSTAMTITVPDVDRLDVTPLSGTIGAEIRGLDLRDRSTTTTVAAIRARLARAQGRVLPRPAPRPRPSTSPSPPRSARPPRATR